MGVERTLHEPFTRDRWAEGNKLDIYSHCIDTARGFK